MNAPRDRSHALFQALHEAPWAHDFFHAVRRIECAHPDRPRIGCALRPADEPVRFGQAPSLAFAPAAIAGFAPPSGARCARLEVAFFGLLGPNGPLPLHLTEFARERLMHAGDPTFARFLDLFNHRFTALFYRAWAQAQPAVSLDRPDSDRFAAYVGSAIGLGTPAMAARDAVPDHAKLFVAGLLARQVRNAGGLEAILTGFFGVAARVEPFVGQWLALPASQRTRLGAHDAGAALGAGAVAGARVWDRQSRFRIRLGPLTLAQYEAFLPGGAALAQLVGWVRQYLHLELDWDVRLVLARDAVPETRPGRAGRLGWTAWLGRRRRADDADDLALDAERFGRAPAGVRAPQALLCGDADHAPGHAPARIPARLPAHTED